MGNRIIERGWVLLREFRKMNTQTPSRYKEKRIFAR